MQESALCRFKGEAENTWIFLKLQLHLKTTRREPVYGFRKVLLLSNLFSCINSLRTVRNVFQFPKTFHQSLERTYIVINNDAAYNLS